MLKAKRFNLEGKHLGDVDLPEMPFGARPNGHVVWESVRNYLGNQRAGTAATKTRSTVSGGGKKPWRQKGTGRARAGTIRSPLWVGGATVFGPQPRSYFRAMPKKMRRLALVSALSQRAQDGNVAVVDRFSFETPRTRTVAAFLSAAGLEGRKVCFVTDRADSLAIRSCRNIPGVAVLCRESLNIYDLVKADVIVFTDDALKGVAEAYGS